MPFARIFCIALALLATACQPQTPEQGADLKTTLPGLWVTTAITVQVNTANGQDTSFTERLEENSWRNRFFVHPPEYFFGRDQKFRREHRSLADTLLSSSRGLWNAFGDTLMLIEPNGTYQYQVSFERGDAIFRTQLDWDGDGDNDDDFTARHRLLRKIEQ